MGMLIDIGKLHTKTIATINGPQKQFNSKEGLREKYKIFFSDGYEAEICPLVHGNEIIPKSGYQYTFRVKHRGQFGDEIEAAQVETKPNSDIPGDKRIVSMSGHPATTAINAAVKLWEVKAATGLLKGKEVNASDILEDADVMLEWLRMKATE